MALAVTGCDRHGGVVPIADSTKAKSVVLRSTRTDVSGISLRVRGHIDGEATLSAANWDKQVLKGTVDWQVYHDWFNGTCTLRYLPKDVKSGALTIEYEFH